MLFNGATDAGLTDRNRASFSVVLTRNAGNSFGLFDDDPFASNPDGAYEVANIRVADFPFILGDINRDRLVGFLDISPFITVLAVGGFQPEADTNGDRAVDFLDISPFIILLSN